MKIDNNFAAIHGYLCGDGYVIRNPKTQTHKYYYIGFRNTNTVLLKDFQEKFEKVFGIKPLITKDRCKVQNKNIYHKLTSNFSYYSDKWKVPHISKENLKYWIRAYFDCDAWVQVQKGKSRSIMVESINGSGLKQIKNLLKLYFGINSSVPKKRKKRNIWYMYICGKENLIKFQQEINFLHPHKRKRLTEAIKSYKTYKWSIPSEKEELIKFLTKKGRVRNDTKEIRFFSIIKGNLIRLKNKLIKYNINAKLYGPWKNNRGKIYYCLTFKQNEFRKIKGDDKKWD